MLVGELGNILRKETGSPGQQTTGHTRMPNAPAPDVIVIPYPAFDLAIFVNPVGYCPFAVNAGFRFTSAPGNT